MGKHTRLRHLVRQSDEEDQVSSDSDEEIQVMEGDLAGPVSDALQPSNGGTEQAKKDKRPSTEQLKGKKRKWTTDGEVVDEAPATDEKAQDPLQGKLTYSEASPFRRDSELLLGDLRI